MLLKINIQLKNKSELIDYKLHFNIFMYCNIVFIKNKHGIHEMWRKTSWTRETIMYEIKTQIVFIKY